MEPWFMILVGFLITFPAATIISYLLFRGFFRNRTIKRIDKRLREGNEFLKRELPESEIPDMPPLKIPEEMKFSKQQKRDIESDIISLEGSVLGSVAFKRSIKKMTMISEKIEKSMSNDDLGESELKEFESTNNQLKNDIEVNKERMRKNINMAKDEISRLKRNSVDVKWYEDYYNNLSNT